MLGEGWGGKRGRQPWKSGCCLGGGEGCGVWLPGLCKVAMAGTGQAGVAYSCGCWVHKGGIPAAVKCASRCACNDRGSHRAVVAAAAAAPLFAGLELT